MNLSRREFLGAIAAGSAGMVLAQSPAASDGEAIVDSHIHVWDLDKLNPPWMARAEAVVKKKFMVPEYEAAIAGTGIGRAVYVEIAMGAAEKAAEAEIVLDLVRRHDRFAGAVIGGDPGDAGFEKHLERFKDVKEVKGVRHFYAKGNEEKPEFLAGVRKIGEMGWAFDLGSHLDLAGMAKIAGACPKTRLIVNHCGNGSGDWYAVGAQKDAELVQRRRKWEEDMGRLAQFDHVAVKISGAAECCKNLPAPPPASPGTTGAPDPAADYLRPVVDQCIALFGQDRILFGSNWPVCLKKIELARWVAVLKQIVASRPAELRRKLWGGNAKSWYRL